MDDDKFREYLWAALLLAAIIVALMLLGTLDPAHRPDLEL